MNGVDVCRNRNRNGVKPWCARKESGALFFFFLPGGGGRKVCPKGGMVAKFSGAKRPDKVFLGVFEPK